MRVGDDLTARQQVTLGVLDGEDARVLGEPAQGVDLDRHDRPRRDVVQHHRQLGGVRDGGEVRVQARLGGPGVVRGHDEQAVRSRLLGLPGHLHTVRRVVRARPGDDRGAVTDRLYDRPHQVGLLRVRRRGTLARGAVDHQPVVSQFHQMDGELLRPLQIHRTLGGERRDHGGEHPAERASRRGRGWGGRCDRHGTDGTSSIRLRPRRPARTKAIRSPPRAPQQDCR